MSALPTRKKSAEELAKLREEMRMPSPLPPAPAPEPEKVEEVEEPRPAPAMKKVRSLKRSERKPAAEPVAVSRDSSALAAHRHSERELEAMRMREAMGVQSLEVPPAIQHLKHISAHPVLLVLGYLLAFAGGVGAFPIALYIAIKKPRSRHHAGFMAVIGLFASIVTALHYFPNLNPAHAS